MITRGKFTEPARVKAALNRYKTDNSTVHTYIEDKELSMIDMLDSPKDILYSEFVDWCKVSGIKTSNITGKKAFYREIIERYNFDEKPQQKGNGKRYFMEKL